MKKQTKTQDETRKAGPKFARSVIPENFQIRRSPSPMAAILDEAAEPDRIEAAIATQENTTLVKTTPVQITPVISPIERKRKEKVTLPNLEDFIDQVLPRFPPAQQAVLLRLYRWSEGLEKDITVSTPRLAAKVNMDEKSVRNHLQSLTAQGFIIRQMDGNHLARFGGNDRSARGLILRLSAEALADLLE